MHAERAEVASDWHERRHVTRHQTPIVSMFGEALARALPVITCSTPEQLMLSC